jgi:hypothetical protein
MNVCAVPLSLPGETGRADTQITEHTSARYGVLLWVVYVVTVAGQRIADFPTLAIRLLTVRVAAKLA